MSQIGALMKMWTETDVRDVLPSIKVPTLVIHREHDVQFRVDHGRYLADHIPDATTLNYPERNHFWIGEDLDQFPDIIEEFVTGRPKTVTSDRVLATVLFTDIVDSTGAIEIRAGLHTGEIERRADDISGLGVHIAARVADLASPGEVLVSSTVKDLVVGSGIAFKDHGVHTLKGVPDQWRVIRVMD